MVILDHISSPSAILFPIKTLVKALHDFGILVLVDGAHAPGQVDLDLNELGEKRNKVKHLFLCQIIEETFRHH